MNAQLVSIYLNESDQWEHHPLHLELLRVLDRAGCGGGTVVRGLAGFTAGSGIVSTSLVDIGSKLPVVVQFVERPEKVAEVLPTLRKMAGKRLITIQDVQIANPSP